jgi:hypothetical protein
MQGIQRHMRIQVRVYHTPSPMDRISPNASERKKLQERPYPKGYVTMLEEHQDRLVKGLQELYYRLLEAGAWNVSPLVETDGKPLTHDILGALGLLNEENDGSGDSAPFEGDLQRLMSSLGTGAKGCLHRQESVSSDLDCGLDVLTGSASHCESVGSNPTLPTERISIPSTISSSPTRNMMASSGVPISQRDQSPNTPLLHHLLRCANEQRGGALEPIQTVGDLDGSLQATNFSIAMRTPDWEDDMNCTMDFQWHKIQSFDDINFDIYASHSACKGANVFTGDLQAITDRYFDYNTYISNEEGG